MKDSSMISFIAGQLPVEAYIVEVTCCGCKLFGHHIPKQKGNECFQNLTIGSLFQHGLFKLNKYASFFREICFLYSQLVRHLKHATKPRYVRKEMLTQNQTGYCFVIVL